jgi:hypothetical protein
MSASLDLIESSEKLKCISNSWSYSDANELSDFVYRNKTTITYDLLLLHGIT